jgi:hypothetical protein
MKPLYARIVSACVWMAAFQEAAFGTGGLVLALLRLGLALLQRAWQTELKHVIKHSN